MKILLHIGQSKTGTSTIQTFLTINRNRLLKAGILYPNVKVSGLTVNIASHNAVADALVEHSRYPFFSADQFFDQFFQQARKHKADRMILSAEHFIGGEPRIWDVTCAESYFNLYSEKIKSLAEYLKGHEVSILAYLRPQVDWLSSTISQTVRIERLISHKYIYQNDSQFLQMVKPQLQYCRLLDTWENILTPKNILAVPYVRENLHNQSSISDFIQRADLSNIQFSSRMQQLQVNTSLTREYTEVKKLLNRQPKTKNHERVTITCLENLSKKSPLSTSYRLDKDIVDEVNNYVVEENNKLNKKYVTNSIPLSSQASYKGDKLEPVRQIDIEKAMEQFKREFKKPHTHLISLQYQTLSLLRRKALPLHAVLHQLRRLQWKLVYG